MPRFSVGGLPCLSLSLSFSLSSNSHKESLSIQIQIQIQTQTQTPGVVAEALERLMAAVRPRLRAALAPVKAGLTTKQTVTLERDGGIVSSSSNSSGRGSGGANDSGIAYHVTFAFDAGAPGGEDAAAAAYSRSDGAFAALVLAPLATLADAFAGALATENRGRLMLLCAATVATLAEQALGISGGAGGEGVSAAAATAASGKKSEGAKRQRRGPRFTAAGALRFERDMRALQSFFLSRVRPERFASLRQKFRRLLTAAAVLTVDRITDVFASTGGGASTTLGSRGGGRLRVDPAFSPFGVADVRTLLLLRGDLDAERVRRLL